MIIDYNRVLNYVEEEYKDLTKEEKKEIVSFIMSDSVKFMKKNFIEKKEDNHENNSL